jgi:hypothetical protein
MGWYKFLLTAFRFEGSEEVRFECSAAPTWRRGGLRVRPFVDSLESPEEELRKRVVGLQGGLTMKRHRSATAMHKKQWPQMVGTFRVSNCSCVQVDVPRCEQLGRCNHFFPTHIYSIQARRALRLLVLSIFPLLVLASSGDRSKAFQDCLVDCYPSQCPQNLPLFLRITLWTCEDDCAYRCSHVVTDDAEMRILAQKGATVVRIQQFYGKWAFWRFLGMQEPASVLFSLLNLRAHVKGLSILKRRVDLVSCVPYTR